jgi:diaminopimelate epimerase
MKIPFTKAHGAKNDFLLTWRQDAPEVDLPALARAICDRHTGVGADGWMLVAPARDADAEASIQLYNSDGSTAEISGNGTRCAAALLVRHNLAPGVVRIRTGAGIKTLRLLARSNLEFQFEMNMGRGEVRNPRYRLPLAAGPREATIVWVGNPQCALAVDDFNFDWRALGAEIESHPAFPDRTNVSFVRRVDQHTIDVRFFERGAGETMSSGTGSTGAAVAAVAWGTVEWPVCVQTPAGPLAIRFQEDIYLTGPAQIVCEGEFFL